jgi:glutathione S-transferase
MLTRIYRPGMAAAAGFVRVLGFIVYVQAYASGDPKKRLYGSFGRLSC